MNSIEGPRIRLIALSCWKLTHRTQAFFALNVLQSLHALHRHGHVILISLLTTTNYYLLPTTYYLLPTTHYPLPTTHYPLPTTHYLLPTTTTTTTWTPGTSGT